jgi:hypothetical protein
MQNGIAQKPPTAGTADAAVADDFEARVKRYLDFRQQRIGVPPKPTDNPAKILARQQEMGTRYGLRGREQNKARSLLLPSRSIFASRLPNRSLAGMEMRSAPALHMQSR